MSRAPDFQVIETVRETQIIAQGRQIRELKRIIKAHGKGRWRKLRELRRFAFRMDRCAERSYIGTKLPVSVARNSKSSPILTDR